MKTFQPNPPPKEIYPLWNKILKEQPPPETRSGSFRREKDVTFTDDQIREIRVLLSPVKKHKSAFKFDPIQKITQVTNFYFAFRELKRYPLAKIRSELKAMRRDLFKAAETIGHLDIETIKKLKVDINWQEGKSQDLYKLSWEAQICLKELPKSGPRFDMAGAVYLGNLAEIYEHATGRVAGLSLSTSRDGKIKLVGPFVRFVKYILNVADPGQLEMISETGGLKTRIKKGIEFYRKGFLNRPNPPAHEKQITLSERIQTELSTRNILTKRMGDL